MEPHLAGGRLAVTLEAGLVLLARRPLGAGGSARTRPSSRPPSRSPRTWPAGPRSETLAACPCASPRICGLLAPVTFVVGLVLGDLAQPDAFSPADDNVSDIGAQTADQAWLYNQIAANLTACSSSALRWACGERWDRPARALGRLGLAGLGRREIPRGLPPARLPGHRRRLRERLVAGDRPRDRVGDHGGAFFLVPPVLALRVQGRPGVARPVAPDLLAVPAVIAASVLFSIIGDGAATRAASITWFLWLGLSPSDCCASPKGVVS